jgi:hypothetical protein
MMRMPRISASSVAILLVVCIISRVDFTYPLRPKLSIRQFEVYCEVFNGNDLTRTSYLMSETENNFLDRFCPILILDRRLVSLL